MKKNTKAVFKNIMNIFIAVLLIAGTLLPIIITLLG
jgi:hypothetical protein